MNYKKILFSITCIFLLFSMVACTTNFDSEVKLNDDEIMDNNNGVIIGDENSNTDNNLTDGEVVTKNLLDNLVAMAESGDEKMGVCNFFIADSLHLDTPGGFGSGISDSYYFFSNNTYFWDAGDYYDPMGRVRAKAGTWRIELLEDDSHSAFKGRLVLNEKYELYTSGDEIGDVDMPGGTIENGIVNYTFTLNEVNNVIKEDIEYVGIADYSLTMGNAKSPAYEYKLGDRVMFSNVVAIDDSTNFVKGKTNNIGSDRWLKSLINLMSESEDILK